MRIAALIVGILGSLAGVIGAIVAMAIGGIGVGVGEIVEDSTVTSEGREIVWLGVVALIASLVGLVGAALAIAKPRISATAMLLAAIVGFICVFVAYIIGGLLLLVAAILAFLGRKEASQSSRS